MSVLSFSARSANMLDPNFFGFGAELSSPEPEVGFSEALITLRDPVTGAELSISGTFDASSEWALLSSPVTALAMRAGDGSQLFEWSGFDLALGAIFGYVDPASIAESIFGGDDTVIGSVESDILFADFPGWHEDSKVADPLATGGRLAMSADGSTLAGVVWHEAIPGVPSSVRRDVALIDPVTGAQRLMSAAGTALQPGASALDPSLSHDGGLLVFRSDDPEFGGGQGTYRVVAVDTRNGASKVVSCSADGVPADADCEAPALSADGSCVVFTSRAHNLLAEAQTGSLNVRQVYSKDLETDAVRVVSSNAAGEAAAGDSFGAAVSLDGRHVAFASYATNLVDGPVPDLGANLYVKDMLTGEVRFVASLGNRADLPEPDLIGLAISLDGGVVAFSSNDPGLVPGDTNGMPDVFVMSLDTGEIERASVDEHGAQAPLGAGSVSLALSGDGAYLAFHTREGGLVQPGSSQWGNVYFRDFTTGMLYRVSDPGAGNAWTPVAMSADGLSLAFTQAVDASAGGDGESRMIVASLHGLGRDLLAGSGGDDVYFAETGDLIVELPGEGVDTVVTVWPRWTLSDGVENLLYGGHGFFSGTGNALGNVMTGGPLADVLLGGAGDDSFEAMAGDDVIDGGAGRDCVVYQAPLSEFSLTRHGAVLRVEDESSRFGADSLAAVERLDFEDMDVNLSVQDVAAAVSASAMDRICELYVGFFGRIPAADGLEYWIGRFIDGRAMASIAEDFYNAGASPELRRFTGYWDFVGERALADEEFVRVVYRNVLGREGRAEGIAYWTDRLADGESRGSLVVTMLDAAHGLDDDPAWGWVGRLLADRTAISRMVAVDWGLNYASGVQQAIEKGMAIAGAVDELPNQSFPDIPIKVFDLEAAVALVGIKPGAIDLIESA